ncbi:hypothetical protein N0M98_06510 [Paenibacillus doosanensis]|uniref:hypothetical protein n=1 Tax=Paenibacillus TaxID=44249 RepID=UPI00201E1747|nr:MULTISPECIES: hypothetical protein [Paenibacillus]MCS7459790.1 hypothetical protein [Paenibacillus doosanensis]
MTATAIGTENLADQYNDLKALPDELKNRFNFFLAKGVLQAEAEDDFGIDQMITRSEFVRVSETIFASEDDEALTNKFRTEFEKLGLITSDGMVVDGDSNISRQDFAKYLIYGIGKADEARKVTPITDASPSNLDKVSNTLARFVTMALQLNIMQNQDDGHFYGDRMVTRRMLVESAYEAKRVYEELTMIEEGKISVTEAKPTGARKVTVAFDKAVDSTKSSRAVLTVKKDGVEWPGTLAWSEDKKSATITLESKLRKGSYTVELSGLDDDSVETKTAEFTAEDERAEKLEFVNSSDQLPRSKVIVDFRQLNQYGEQTEAAAGMFDVYASRISVSNVPREQAFKLDLSEEKRGSSIMVSIYDRTNDLRVNKSFVIGDFAIVSKIKLGKLAIHGSKQYLQPGNKAYLSFTAYDQYGYRMDNLEDLETGIYKRVEGESLFSNMKDNTFEDYDNDGYPELVLETYSDFKHDTSSVLHLMSMGSGEDASLRISVVTPKVPASVEVKEPSGVIAEGDKNLSLELIVRDAEGYVFSTQEKLDLYKSGELQVRSTGGIKLPSSSDGGAVNSGGNIAILEATGSGKASIEASLRDSGQKTVRDLDVKDERVPVTLERLDFDQTHVYRLIPEANKGFTFKFNIKDQYDEVFTPTSNEYQMEYELKRIGGDEGAYTGKATGGGKQAINDANPVIRQLAKDAAGKGVEVTPATKKLGSYSLTARLVKAKQDSKETDPTKWPIAAEISSMTARTQSFTWAELNSKDRELNYYAEMDSSYFAVGKFLIDQGIIQRSNKEKKIAIESDAKYILANKSNLVKDFKNIVAKDKDGFDISIPTPKITSVVFSTPNIVSVDNPSDPKKIVALNPGSTTALIGFTTPNGTKTVQMNLTVFASDLKFSELKYSGAKTISPSDINDYYIWDTKFSNLQVKDDLNNTFTNTADKSQNKNSEMATPFLDLFGVSITLADVTYKAGTKEEDKDTLYMTDDYKLVFKPKSGQYSMDKVNLQGFTIKAVGPDQKEKNVVVTLK